MKRLPKSILLGAILGIFCIVGMSYRLGYVGNELLILSAWFNRVLMGLVIGLAPYYKIKKTTQNVILRGALLGFIVSGAWYLDTGFADQAGFLAGIAYGVIIDYVATKY